MGTQIYLSSKRDLGQKRNLRPSPCKRCLTLSASAICIFFLTFRAIKFPFQGAFTNRICICVILAVFVLSFVPAFPAGYYRAYKPRGIGDYWQCGPSMSVEALDAYYTLLAIFITFLPLCIIITLQTLSYKILQQSVIRFGKATERLATVRQVSRQFIVVTSVFFLLTTPFTIAEVVVSYIEITESNVDLLVDVLNTCLLIQNLNSCANPLIYGKVHRWFFKLFSCHHKTIQIHSHIPEKLDSNVRSINFVSLFGDQVDALQTETTNSTDVARLNSESNETLGRFKKREIQGKSR